jgi:hypothetical protein
MMYVNGIKAILDEDSEHKYSSPKEQAPTVVPALRTAFTFGGPLSMITRLIFTNLGTLVLGNQSQRHG